LRILSPVVGYFGAINDLTLRRKKGQPCWVRKCRGHKYKVGRNLDTCTEGQKKGRFGLFLPDPYIARGDFAGAKTSVKFAKQTLSCLEWQT